VKLPDTGAADDFASLLIIAAVMLLAGAWLRLRAARSPAAR
jgi:LPXTG-motif cell wall-anchored protein